MCEPRPHKCVPNTRRNIRLVIHQPPSLALSVGMLTIIWVVCRYSIGVHQDTRLLVVSSQMLGSVTFQQDALMLWDLTWVIYRTLLPYVVGVSPSHLPGHQPSAQHPAQTCTMTRCHAPNRFGTVNMEDNVNIK